MEALHILNPALLQSLSASHVHAAASHVPSIYVFLMRVQWKLMAWPGFKLKYVSASE